MTTKINHIEAMTYYEHRREPLEFGLNVKGKAKYIMLISNYQRPKAEGLSKIRVAKNFGYRVEVCLFRRRYVSVTLCTN